MSFLLLLNAEEYIGNNTGNQTAAEKKENKKKYTIGVNGDQKPSGYEHSSKYLLLC